MGYNFSVFLIILWLCLTKELLAQQNAPQSNTPRAIVRTLTELGKDFRTVDDEQSGDLNGNEKKMEPKKNVVNSHKSESEQDVASGNGKIKGVAFSYGGGKVNNEKSLESQKSAASLDSSLSAGIRTGTAQGVNNMSNKQNKEFVSFFFDEGHHDMELSPMRLDQMYGPSLNKFYLNALRVLCIITSGCLVGAIYYVTWLIFTRRSRDCVKYPSPMSNEQTAIYKVEIMDSYT